MRARTAQRIRYMAPAPECYATLGGSILRHLVSAGCRMPVRCGVSATLTLAPVRSAWRRQSAYGHLRLMSRMVTVGREVVREIRPIRSVRRESRIDLLITAAAAGGLRPRRPARAVRRRPPDTRLGHRPRRAAGHRQADQHRAGPDRAGPDRRRAGTTSARARSRSTRRPRCPDISSHRDHHPGRLARRRPHARRRQLPAGATPVIILRGHQLRPSQPGLTLAAGDRVSLLTAAPGGPPERDPGGGHHAQPAADGTSHHS